MCHIKRENRRLLEFTIIELLVVIAIITILLCLLLPALKNARAFASQTQCSSQERQITLGLMEYTSDNNGYFPCHSLYGWDTSSWNWAYAIRTGGYINNNIVYKCPAADGILTNSICDGDRDCVARPESITAYAYIGYGINYCYITSCIHWSSPPTSDTNAMCLFPASITRVKRPSECILLGDTCALTAVDSVVPNGKAYAILVPHFADPNGAINDRHKRGANIMWVDGHVTYKKEARYLYQQPNTEAAFKIE